MTRINVVPPEELSRLHLIAEYRELPRVIGLATKAHERGMELNAPRIPGAYCLGKGHVMFFYPRLGFIVERHAALVKEMLRRGYKPQQTGSLWFPGSPPSAWFGRYTPTPEALALNRARILERTFS